MRRFRKLWRASGCPTSTLKRIRGMVKQRNWAIRCNTHGKCRTSSLKTTRPLKYPVSVASQVRPGWAKEESVSPLKTFKATWWWYYHISRIPTSDDLVVGSFFLFLAVGDSLKSCLLFHAKYSYTQNLNSPTFSQSYPFRSRTCPISPLVIQLCKPLMQYCLLRTSIQPIDVLFPLCSLLYDVEWS